MVPQWMPLEVNLWQSKMRDNYFRDAVIKAPVTKWITQLKVSETNQAGKHAKEISIKTKPTQSTCLTLLCPKRWKLERTRCRRIQGVWWWIQLKFQITIHTGLVFLIMANILLCPHHQNCEMQLFIRFARNNLNGSIAFIQIRNSLKSQSKAWIKNKDWKLMQLKLNLNLIVLSWKDLVVKCQKRNNIYCSKRKVAQH